MMKVASFIQFNMEKYNIWNPEGEYTIACGISEQVEVGCSAGRWLLGREAAG